MSCISTGTKCHLDDDLPIALLIYHHWQIKRAKTHHLIENLTNRATTKNLSITLSNKCGSFHQLEC